jgi:twitching motility two-component system response regulator PilH
VNTTLVSTILIVEDSPSELELMSYYLQDAYNVVSASGATNARCNSH